MNYRLVVHSLGNLLLLLAAAMILPAIWSIIDRAPDLPAFLSAILISALAGISLRSVKPTGAFSRREGFVVVGLGWILLTALGALPFRLSGAMPSYVDAFFETMSGFTTTGSTVLREIESLPRGILFWRSLTHWLGGMGIIVLSLAVFSVFHTGTALYNAEAPGHAKDKFLPRLRQMATILWLIYLSLSVVQTVLLLAAGVSLFESLVHTFGTMATGGFSTRNISVEAFQSPLVEAILIVFMILAGMSFSLYYRIIQRKSLSPLLNSLETKTFLSIIGLSTFVVALNLIAAAGLPALTAFRHSLFQTVSMITTTGFTSANYDLWPPLAKGILFILMFIGGCTVSTSGAIKVARVILLCKYAWRQLLKVAHPRLVIQTKLDDALVTDTVVHEILAFFFMYMGLFAFGALVVMATGHDLLVSFSAAATTLGNVGPGFGAIGPLGNFAAFHPAAKWVLSFLMLAGRLEILTIMVMFTPGFWRR